MKMSIPTATTDQRARVLASDMMTATSLVSKINNQRNRITGGYDIPTDEPGPVNIVAQALADERRRVWEEAAKMAENNFPYAATDAEALAMHQCLRLARKFKAQAGEGSHDGA